MALRDLDRIPALRPGADDFLTKDESLVFIVARLHALFARHRVLVRAVSAATEPPAGRLRRGDLEIDLKTHTAT